MQTDSDYCPYCHNENIGSYPQLEWDEDYQRYFQEWICYNCGQTWYEEYTG